MQALRFYRTLIYVIKIRNISLIIKNVSPASCNDNGANMNN